MIERKSPYMQFDNHTHTLLCEGDWTIFHVHGFLDDIKTIIVNAKESITLDGGQIKALDSAGALVLHKIMVFAESVKKPIRLSSFAASNKELLELVDNHKKAFSQKPPTLKKENPFAVIGKGVVEKLKQLDGLVILVGELASRLFYSFGHPRRFQIWSIIANVWITGMQALPILALLSFLIGIVLAYQLGLQLQDYGANVYIALLTGLAIFREFGPLLTAIIVAGRTSSAFTAQLGTMKMQEELDALRTMGLSPVELLILPKVIGLVLVFPLLIFWADAFAIFGSMVMSKSMLNLSYTDFLIRLKESVGMKHFLVGEYKAPTFAVLIALVGCFQGLRVDSHSATIGSQTTKSVVQALFLIIIADAIYSIIYSWMDI